MKRLILILTLIFTIASLNHAQILKWHASKGQKTFTTEQWQVNDVIYKIKQQISNPFKQNPVAVVNEGNEVKRIPLFFNGNGEWVFRYSASSTGKKSFFIESDIKELNGKKGTFIVTVITSYSIHYTKLYDVRK